MFEVFSFCDTEMMTSKNYFIDWGNLLSGFIGAIIGGLLSLAATFWAHHLEKNRQLVEVDRNCCVFLKSIRAEIESIFLAYTKGMGKRVGELTSNQPLLYIYPIQQNYFNVYDNQTALLGLIKDTELLSQIVKCYVEMKSLADSFLMNNAYLEKLEIYQNRQDNQSKPIVILLKRILIEYAAQLKNTHNNLTISIPKLISAIDGYLSSKKI